MLVVVHDRVVDVRDVEIASAIASAMGQACVVLVVVVVV